MTSDNIASPQKFSRGVLVLGMHRSGTSALTGALVELGLRAGKPLLGANEGNPKGHFELVPALEHNERLLTVLGRRWSDSTEMPSGWWSRPEVKEHLPQAVSIVRSLAEQGEWVLKDPRLCLLLPHWLEACELAGVPVGCVVVLRSPVEIADSLSRRDGIHPLLGALMWVRHLSGALSALDWGVKTAVVSFDTLLADWRSCVDALSVAVDVSLDLERGASLVDAFLEPKLHRSRAVPLADDSLLVKLADWYGQLEKCTEAARLAEEFQNGLRNGLLASLLEASFALANTEIQRRRDRITELESLRLGLVEDRLEETNSRIASANEALLVHVTQADSVNGELNRELALVRERFENAQEMLETLQFDLGRERRESAPGQMKSLEKRRLKGEWVTPEMKGALSSMASGLASRLDALHSELEALTLRTADLAEAKVNLQAAIRSEVSTKTESIISSVQTASQATVNHLERVTSSGFSDLNQAMECVKEGVHVQMDQAARLSRDLESAIRASTHRTIEEASRTITAGVGSLVNSLSSSQAASVDSVLDELRLRLNHLEAERQRLLVQHEELGHKATALELELLRNQKSISWKATAPLRWLGKLLQRRP